METHAQHNMDTEWLFINEGGANESLPEFITYQLVESNVCVSGVLPDWETFPGRDSERDELGEQKAEASM